MPAARHHLRLVPPRGTPEPVVEVGTAGELEDLVLTAAIFAIAFLPIVSALAHVGQWSEGELGLGAAGSLFAGRELWTCTVAALRARRRS